MTERDEPRPEWDMNKDAGSSWAAERRTPTTGQKLSKAAREAVKALRKRS